MKKGWMTMIINKFITKLIALWVPLFTLFISIYFLLKDEFTFVFGLIVLGIALDSLIDWKLKGLANEDERYLFLKRKGNDFAHRMTYSVIIIFIIIHFFFVPLETGVILILLLLTTYISSALGTLYLNLKY